MGKVFQIMSQDEEQYSFSLMAKEIDYYYNQLGLNWAYFRTFTPKQISRHVHAFIAAKKIAQIGGFGENINLPIVRKNAILYMFTKKDRCSVVHNIEQRIRKMSTDYAVVINYMRSTGTIEAEGQEKMMFIEGERRLYSHPEATTSVDIE